MDTNRVITGDCIDELQGLPKASVHMCMTSPPYWNLRDYGVDGQLGQEADAEAYVSNIADVMDEVKRVLRDDGSLWLNLGDTYANKDLQQIPARVALELQNRGWILRNRVTWNKPNPMPQSVKDRLNDTTEAVFQFVLNREYWYDLDAIREPHAESTHERDKYGNRTNGEWVEGQDDNHNASGHSGMDPAGKNPGDVFEVTTKPFPYAHFAVYPPELCEKPIKATCPPKVCVGCGTPYERDVEENREEQPWEEGGKQEDIKSNNDGARRSAMSGKNYIYPEREHKGWNQNCNCSLDGTEPGTALDPFAGAGTTLLKAKALGRDFIGIELNPEYADMARGRIGIDVENPDTLRGDDAQTGFENY